MIDMMISILKTIAFPAELLIATMLFASPQKRRKGFFLRLLISAPSIVLLSGGVLWLVVTLFPAIETISIPLIVFYSCEAYLAAVLVILLCYRVTLVEALYHAACAYLTQHFTYCLLELIYPSSMEVRNHDLVYFLVYGMTYWASWCFFARKLTREGLHIMDSRRAVGTTVGVLMIALVLSAVGQEYSGESVTLNNLCLIYSMVCCFYILWEQVGQQQRLKLQHDLDIREQLWLQQKIQFQVSTENVELINRKCHDLKHQIALLRRISDQTKREESIRSLEQSVMIYDAMIKTGNDILDTVLTEKSLVCEARGIELTCVADGGCLNFMDAVDIYTMFGNALDNAIECVSKLEDPEQRVISIMVFSRADVVILQLENYHAGELVFDGDLPVTNKEQNGYHGFGLKSIRYTAEKYRGFLTVETADRIFLLRVTIPLLPDQ